MPNIVTRMSLRELTDELSEVEGMVVVTFGGLDVAETESLRSGLAEKGVKFKMVRNRLARRALAERGLELEGCLAGNTAIAYGDTEATIAAAKVLTAPEVKKTGKVKLKAGLLDGSVLGSNDAVAMANIPDRETLQAMLLGVISGPARGLATVINAVPAATARVLQARADELEKQGG